MTSAGSDDSALAGAEAALRPKPALRAVELITGAAFGVIGAGGIGAMVVESIAGGGVFSPLEFGLFGVLSLISLHFLRRGVLGRPPVEWTDDELILRTSVLGIEYRIPLSDIRNVHRRGRRAPPLLEFVDGAEARHSKGLRRGLHWIWRKLRGERGMEVSGAFLGLGPGPLGEVLETKLLQWERRRMGAGRRGDAPRELPSAGDGAPL